jgi:hypothetical protein
MCEILKIICQSISFIIMISIPLIISGCSSSAEYIPEKMDAPLRQRISYLEREDPNTPVQFTGRTNQTINDELKKKLEDTGIKVESTIGDIFTASGNVESTKKVTMLDFVVFLEIAKKMDIK